ncbi:chromate transporter [Ensifer sp. YR511]|uniref:chromate transporter n=1 Tax=Ensifer sp. YR511 TaxID=1855294 RepID=UPI0008878076|nr:chromate transporter [Ensifer sp. YR511]SDO17409.1 chromate transporter [Ensifer sp. YR511]
MTRASEPSLSRLFTVCFKIGILSFGGGLSGWLRREFVELTGWISDEEFTSSLAFAQVLPGANVVNLVITLGDNLRGPLGALACFTGFLLGPFFGVLAMMSLLSRFAGPLLDTALIGVTFAAIALIAAVCLSSVVRIRHTPANLLIAVVIGILVGLLEFPLVWTVLCAAPVSIALAWRTTK